VGAAVNAPLAIQTVAVENDPPAQADAAATPGRCYLFLIEGREATDALMRVLGPFAVQSAGLTRVTFGMAEGRFAARIEVEGLSQDRADYLSRRLTQIPLIASVSFGWRN
jgi:hypothetical protein